MRESLHPQLPLVPGYVEHAFGRALAAMSDLLEAVGREVLDLVWADLVAGLTNPEVGRSLIVWVSLED